MKDKINPTHGQDTHDRLDEVWTKITTEAERVGMGDLEFLFISITPMGNFGDRSLQDLLEQGDVDALEEFYTQVKAQDDAVLGDDGNTAVA